MEKLKFMLVATGVFNIADYFFTNEAIAAGMAEGNPIMDAILHTNLFPFIKLLAVPFGLYLLWRVRHRVPRLAYYAWVPFLAYGMLTIYHGYLYTNGYFV